MSIKQFPGGVITQNPTAPTTAAAKGIWTLAQASDFVKQGIWPRIPGAPTIGTATGSAGSATVTYTAPTDLGTGAVTYTATSSPGGLTGTGASPITVSGLTNGTPYTFTVTASTPGGTGPASAASNSVTPALPAIGAAFGGGYYAGQISTTANQVATHYLIVADATVGVSYGTTWGTMGIVTGVTSRIAGPTNSSTLAALGVDYAAANFCENLNTGGYTDWYMPAIDELGVAYYFLKPNTNNNNTSFGANLYSVSPQPYNTNYATTDPTQTTSADFQTAGAQAFLGTSGDHYQASFENNSNTSRGVVGGNGGNDAKNKNNTASYTRAFRRVPV